MTATTTYPNLSIQRSPLMRITVKLFGPQAFRAGTRKLMLEIKTNTTCAQLKSQLTRHSPPLAQSIETSRLAINHRFATHHQIVCEDDELALIGMTSGG